METATFARPLSVNQIAGLKADDNGETRIAFYVSIPGLGHKVYKCKGCGVRNASALAWLMHFRDANQGCDVIALESVLADRIQLIEAANGKFFEVYG